jgi:hypothetical protein
VNRPGPSALSRLVSRRRLLQAGLGVAALAAGMSHLERLVPWRLRRARSETRRVAVQLANTDNARAIGRSYLRLCPQEASADILERHIARRCDAISSGEGARAAGDGRTRFANAVARDFAEERIARVDGWILSVTEARLCALAALTG